MKKYILLSIIITLGLFFSVAKSYSKTLNNMDIRNFLKETFSSPKDFSYETAWAEVKKLENAGKLNEAYKKVKEILKHAKEDKNYPQIIKTFIYSLDYQNQTVDDGFYPELKKMEDELVNFPESDKAVMHSVLGEIYLNYLKIEYFAISKRTDVEVQDGNVATYSTKQLLRTAKQHFIESIKNIDELKKRKTLDYKDILTGLRKNQEELRPTLYDFLAYRALDVFFQADISRYEVFDDNFDVNNDDLLKSQEEFLNLKFDDKLYENSAAYQAFLIYQNLIRTHKDDSDKNVLLYNDLNRLKKYYIISTSEDKEESFLATLDKMENKFSSDKKLCDKITWEKAQYYYKKKDYVKAKNFAQKIVDNNAGNPEGSNAKTLIKNVEMHHLEAIVDKFVPQDNSITFKLTHRNIDKVYFRIGKISKSFYDRPEYTWEKYLTQFEKAMSECQDFSFEVEKNSDYTSSQTEISLPGQKYGYYAVMISDQQDFSRNETCFQLLQITDLVCVTSLYEGFTNVKVVDRENGKPIENATVKAIGEEYKNNKWVWTTYAEKQTDKNGNAGFKHQEINYKGYSLSFTAEKGKDIFDKHTLRFEMAEVERKTENLKIFTDRALYRPGQTVFFKGVCYEKEGNNVNVIAGKKIYLQVLDINRQSVYSDTLSTNEFGSISGSFQLGTSVVLGNYRFEVYSLQSYHTFSVEEYKRPTFEIFTDDIENELVLNQDITLSGNAKTYSGVMVENAEVKYEVVRTPRFLGWWWFNYPLKEKSIANGIVKTDENGKFSITFNAKPDKSLPEDLGLTFDYNVKIEVTSQDGETQLKNTYLSAGYAGIFLSKILPLDTYLKNNKKFQEVKVSATNASGNDIDCEVKVIVKKLKNFANPLPDNDLYKLEEDKVLKTFSVKSNTKTDLSLLENMEDGNYCIRLETNDSQGHNINSESRFTLISENCKKADFNKYFWFNNLKYTCNPGEKAKFIFGTSQKDVILWYEIFQGSKSLTGEKSIKLSQNSQTIEFPITEENRGGISIRYFFVKNNKSYCSTSGVSVPYSNKNLEITYESFRDKLEPGDKETIRLKILDKDGNIVNAELLASLYDESLDAIRSNPWHLSVYGSNPYCSNYSLYDFYQINARGLRTSSEIGFYYPSYDLALNWFNHQIYSFGRQNMIPMMAYGARSLNKTFFHAKMAQESAMAVEECADAITIEDHKVELMAKTTSDEESMDSDNGAEFGDVKVRENFSETAFFSPHLVTDSLGNVLIEFTIPESLTKWHFNAFAHTKDMKLAFSENHLITQKSLMVEPNLPRFFMEGDEITIPVKISNLTEQNLNGKVKIDILDAQSNQPVKDYKIDETIKDFSVEANHTSTAEFSIKIPKRPEPVIIKIVGLADKFSDGSQKFVPVLTTRVLITETQSFNIRANQTKNFVVEGLKKQSKTQDNQSFTFEFTSNPAWLAFMSLPSLRETTSENFYSIMSAYYANSIARKIITSNPGFEKTYNELSEEDLKSALEKNQELKSILLNETPWLLDAKTESEQMRKLAHLFNKKNVDNVNQEYIKKLKDGQYSDGGWPWLKGMKQNRFITQEILCDLGRLTSLEAIENEKDKEDVKKMSDLAVNYIDKELAKDYKELKKILTKAELEAYKPGYYELQYFYTRSFYLQHKVPKSTQEAYDFFLNKIEKYWADFSMYGRAIIATSFKRLGRENVPIKIIESFKDNAQNSEEFGMYYSKNLNGYHWYNSPIETQAMIIEAFATFNKPHEVEELKIWLIKNKQTNSWPSSRATVEAVYALLMNGEKLSTEEKPCQITIGGKALDEVASKGAAYIKKSFPKEEISQKQSDIEIINPNNHIAFGASYLQYFEEYDNVRSTANGLTLKKELYLIKKNALGEDVAKLITPETPLHPGDKIKARFVITTDRDLEFVFLKDNHSAAFEPINKLSGMRFQDGLFYYESTKDAAEEFFIEFMQRGTYVFEYQLFAVHKGVLTNGIATVECMYSPEFRANSTSQKVRIE